MPLSELQKEREKWPNVQYAHYEVIRNHPEGKYKVGEKVWIKQYGSMVCWDKNGRWFSYYDLKQIPVSKEEFDKIKHKIIW